MDKVLLWKVASVISAVFGLGLLSSVLFPIVSYESASRVKYPTLLNPLVEDSSQPSLESYDLTRASNWFADGAKKEEFAVANISYYTLSIPKLGIENASVAIGGEDLSKSLIQYPGTALPGKRGNTVIFGHSILPQFYNPKNYMAIFSTLPTMEKGDEVFIEYDGVSYKYQVFEMFEVLPTNLDVLKQGQADSTISLITCVPPGHPLKPRRLIVRAKIVPFDVSANAKQTNSDFRN